jgi:hypothetical protein
LAAIRGEGTDRPAFSPFLTYCFESLPPEVQRNGYLAYLEAMGADPLMRGFGCAWEVRYPFAFIEETVHGNRKRQTITNAKGVLILEWT